MTVLRNRQLSVVLGDVALSPELRITFSITKTTEKQPNTCELTINNLSPDTYARLLRQVRPPVQIIGGYEGETGLLYAGQARLFERVREGAETITRVKCPDGERAYSYSRLALSFKSGTPLAEVAHRAAQALGISLGNLETQLATVSTRLQKGYAYNGNAFKELDRVLKNLGFTLSIQDNALLVLATGQTLPGLAVSLSPTSGLVGSPERVIVTKDGKPTGAIHVKARALLRPQVRCGSQVQILSNDLSGFYKVLKVAHRGDTRGQDWYTEIEASPL